jgi:MbtH protein
MGDSIVDSAPPSPWQVVENQDGRMSVWPAERDVPPGWNAVGPAGPKEDCLDWIAGQWVDSRPTGVGRRS